MPTLVDYETVLARMAALGLRCLYFNSGAFGFDADASTHFTGWIGAPDPTLRPHALARARQIAEPASANLARMATDAWKTILPGEVWVMPKSSWAYELDFGSKDWLPEALRAVGIDPALLQGRTDAPAVAFTIAEAERFTPFVQTLLERLFGSDFALAFPDWPIACTVHHHKQLWWVSNDEKIIERLARL